MLLHLGLNVITLRTFITFRTSYYTCAFNRGEGRDGGEREVRMEQKRGWGWGEGGGGVGGEVVAKKCRSNGYDHTWAQMKTKTKYGP